LPLHKNNFVLSIAIVIIAIIIEKSLKFPFKDISFSDTLRRYEVSPEYDLKRLKYIRKRGIFYE